MADKKDEKPTLADLKATGAKHGYDMIRPPYKKPPQDDGKKDGK